MIKEKVLVKQTLVDRDKFLAQYIADEKINEDRFDSNTSLLSIDQVHSEDKYYSLYKENSLFKQYLISNQAMVILLDVDENGALQKIDNATFNSNFFNALEEYYSHHEFLEFVYDNNLIDYDLFNKAVLFVNKRFKDS
ncbi:hypothetical protein AAIA71_11550 [Vibrio harveyi]|uniref:hypothetical protein n=1 Tax=Vibrio harveyi TaxID=669 RepID=UPI0031BA8345